VKNKVAPPFKFCEVDLIYGLGVSRESEIIDLGVEKDIIQKSGSWYAYNEEKIGQGKENVRNYLNENPNLMKEIVEKIYIAYGLKKEN
ncbi:MAG: DNA recombination/repair protein RecA, partial [Bacilli bacterium]